MPQLIPVDSNGRRDVKESHQRLTELATSLPYLSILRFFLPHFRLECFYLNEKVSSPNRDYH